MPEPILVSPDGVKYRLISTKTTTPTSDAEAKQIRTETDSVEVIVSDSRLISRGSQFGHVAIVVNGITYSRAHDGYDSKKKYPQYVAIQETFRDSIGYVLRVSPEEKKKIETELKRRVAVTSADPEKHGYSLLDNSCSSNVADVLNLVGIVAYDPRWSAFGMVSPEDIAVGLSHSKRVKEKRFYPKDGS
ncbi:hypothetical protein [Burkholderia ubonensis]|uniref:hypothetical protein n=1 Tax=Burkholderia ubonensis TaxID=101571 RepID=UPI0005D761AB|nr:hypothetical protein [Burkholderia ubonensis]AJX16565.1 hypothetical protein BW23_167 [Burkholderia ubonensis MSMB22]KVP90048.1 hypothetical protein WJ97_24025 [Burkholderia ubonensis]OJB35758.1 hypothetical protein BGV57_28005 [Burkholderia ubonensis]